MRYEGHCVNYADPSCWSQVAWDFPRLSIIIAHLGGDRSFEALKFVFWKNALRVLGESEV